MEDEEEGILSCSGMFWIDAAKKMALDCRPCDDDCLPRSERSETVGDGTVLKREDMVVHGLCPARDEFFLVVCEQCQMLVKPQALAYHIDLRHRLGIGESPSAFLSSTPSSTAATEKAIPRKRPTIAKPCESIIGDAVIKSTMCRRRRSRRAKVKGRSRIATQRQPFAGVDTSNSAVTSSSLFPVGMVATPGNASSVFVPRKFGNGGGLAVDLLNQRPFVEERLVTDVEPSSIEVEGLSQQTDSKTSGRGIIIRFAHLNRGKGPWIAEMGARGGREEPRERGPILLKDQSPSLNDDDLKSLSFSGLQRVDVAISKGSEVLSVPEDYYSQSAEGHDLDISVTDTLKRRKPLPSVFKHRKICTEPLHDSSATAPSFAHSNLYHVEKSIQFPLPPIGGSCFSVPVLMPPVHFQDSYSSIETVVNGELGYEEHVELHGGYGIRGGNVGRDFDANVQTCQDMSRHVNVDSVSMITLQPSIPVPFRPPFVSESWIGPGSDVVGVRSLGSSRSWCHPIVVSPGSSSNAKELIGMSLRLEDDGFAGSGLAQEPSLSGSHDDSVCNDVGATLVTADSFPSVDCRSLFPPWTRGAGEATWNGGTVSNALGSAQEQSLASSTVSVVPNDSAQLQLDVSSATVEPVDHEMTSTDASHHRETLPFLGRCVSSDDDDPCFSSNNVHPDMLSHVDPPSAPTHFSSKFHLTATAALPLSVGAQALTSAQVPCVQPWLCRIGANDS